MKFAFDFNRANARFEKAFGELARGSKKTARELFLQQARGVARNVFAVTPPMGGRNPSVKLPKPGSKARGIAVNWKEGKDAGQRKILGDLAKATSSVPLKRWQRMADKGLVDPSMGSLSGALAWYRSIQNRRKKPSAAHKPTPAPVVKELRKYLLSRQGVTPSGWLVAARRMGVAGIPKWITRHNLPGGIDLDANGDVMWFEAVNNTTHSNSRLIQRQLATAIEMQTNSIERWLKAQVEKGKLTR